LKPRKYEYNVIWQENGKQKVEWDSQDPEATTEALIAAGFEPTIIHNLGQAHYMYNGKFLQGDSKVGEPRMEILE
jgi:hypothetical protein